MVPTSRVASVMEPEPEEPLPSANETHVLDVRFAPLVRLRLPPLMATMPRVEDAPSRVSVPVPILVTERSAPDSALAKVTSLLLVSKMAPLASNALRREETSMVVPLAQRRPPPFRVMLALPKLARESNSISPPVTEVPPW